MLADPVAPRLVLRMELKTPPSADSASVMLPDCIPAVRVVRCECISQREALHAIPVSDIHLLLSHFVCEEDADKV